MNIIARHYAMRTTETEPQLVFTLPAAPTWVAVRGSDPTGAPIADVHLVPHGTGGAFNWLPGAVYEVVVSSSAISLNDQGLQPVHQPTVYGGLNFSLGGEDPPPPPPPAEQHGPTVQFTKANIKRIV